MRSSVSREYSLSTLQITLNYYSRQRGSQFAVAFWIGLLQSFCNGLDVKLADCEDIPSDQLAPGGCDKDLAHVAHVS